MKPVFIFDLGKVLVDFDYSIAAKKIAARSTHSPQSLHAFLGTSPLLVQLESGQISRQHFFDAVKQAVGFQGDIEEFSKFFAEIFSPIHPMIDLHAELRQRGFQTYIFSNTNDLAIEHIQNDFPFFKNFNGYIFSYEVGAMKPQPKIYEAMEQMCGKSGGDLIYIDDRPENIETGKLRDWKSILHEAPEKTRDAVEKLIS